LLDFLQRRGARSTRPSSAQIEGKISERCAGRRKSRRTDRKVRKASFFVQEVKSNIPGEREAREKARTGAKGEQREPARVFRKQTKLRRGKDTPLWDKI